MRTLAIMLLSAAVLGTTAPSTAFAQPASAPPDAPSDAPPAPSPAEQEEAKKNAARELADKGYDYFEDGEYQKAIQLFNQADTIFHAPTLVLMQAHAQAKSGNIIEARALYQRVVNEGIAASAPKEYRAAHDEAKTSLEALTGKTGYLKIVLQGQAPEKVAIVVDGIPVPPSRIGQKIEQNPGKRKIEATIDTPEGGRTVYQTVNIRAGRTKQIKLAFRAGSVRVEADKQDEDDFDVTGEGSIVPAAISFSVGALGVGTGAVTGFLWLNKGDEIKEKCGGASTCPAAQGDIDTKKTLGTVAIIGFAAGGVGLGLGTILALTRSTSEAELKTEASVFVGPGSITVKGTF